MKLWLLTQDYNRQHDVFERAVVAAETEEDACKVPVGDVHEGGTWAPPSRVIARLLGEATPGTKTGVILRSFKGFT